MINSIAPVNILLVEDDRADQKLIRTSLSAQKIESNLHIANSAEEALDFLLSYGSSSSNKPPTDLILLDLNMPGMGGMEFLKSIKSNEELKQIPVVVLTTSNSNRDVEESYRLQAAGYVHKPGSLGEFKQVMKDIGDYWFLLCKLPRKER